MTDLIVVGFKKDMYRATQVLKQLRAVNKDWEFDLQDAVAVYRDPGGNLRIDQRLELTSREHAAWGGFWGSLIGLTLAMPVAIGVSTAVAAGALAAGTLGGAVVGAATGTINGDWWTDTYGIDEDFVRQVSAILQPGDSAIFVLVRTADPTYVADTFRGYGGTVLRSTLTPEQVARVQAVLDGKP